MQPPHLLVYCQISIKRTSSTVIITYNNNLSIAHCLKQTRETINKQHRDYIHRDANSCYIMPLSFEYSVAFSELATISLGQSNIYKSEADVRFNGRPGRGWMCGRVNYRCGSGPASGQEILPDADRPGPKQKF